MFEMVRIPRGNVLILSDDPHNNLSEIRLGQPLRGLIAQMGWSLRMLPFREFSRQDLRWADVVVMQRATQAREMILMEWLQDQGIPVIYEIDDLLTNPAAHLISMAELVASAPIVTGMLRAADHVSASTPRLVAHLSPMTRSVGLVPNYGPLEYADAATHDEVSVVTLVVAATDRQLIGAMSAGIKLLLADPALRIELVAFAAMADCLADEGLACRRIEMKPRDDFFRAVAELVNPIGLIPLDGSPFSSCKSAVKYFDYSCLGVPCVCSNRPPYADVIRDGFDGILCDDDPHAWASAIGRLVGDARLRVAMAGAARQKIQTHYTLAHTQEEWRKILVRMFERSALTRKPVPVLEWCSEKVTSLLAEVRRTLKTWNHRRVTSRRAGRLSSS
jgi:hypothetical protein